MPPKRTNDGATGRSGAPSSGSKPRSRAAQSSNPFDSDEPVEDEDVEVLDDEEDERSRQRAKNKRQRGNVEEEEAPPEKTIPKELLTRLLHEFFAKDATRLSRDANAAVGKYVDVFVREAIARTAVEKQGGFLEVEDLEKVTPQLLLDL